MRHLLREQGWGRTWGEQSPVGQAGRGRGLWGSCRAFRNASPGRLGAELYRQQIHLPSSELEVDPSGEESDSQLQVELVRDLSQLGEAGTTGGPSERGNERRLSSAAVGGRVDTGRNGRWLRFRAGVPQRSFQHHVLHVRQHQQVSMTTLMIIKDQCRFYEHTLKRSAVEGKDWNSK